MDPRLLLSVLCSCAECFALVRLLKARVRLLVFCFYLLVTGLQPFIFLAGTYRSRGYATAWAISTALVLGVRMAVIGELWTAAMRQYRNIETIAAYLTLGIVGSSVAMGFIAGFGAGRFGLSRVGLFHFLTWASRYEPQVLCSICGLLCLWMEVFKASRNLTIHARLLTGYFLSQTVAMFVIIALPSSSPVVGAASVGSAAGLYVLWGVLLTQQGEAAYVAKPRMNTTLASVNALMRRALDKVERQA